MQYECLICHDKFDRRSLPNHIHSKHKLKAVEYYDKYIEPNTSHICPTCGKPNKFRNIFLGYSKHCSTKCSSLDPIVQDKLKNTCLSKYGVEYNLQQPEVIKKNHSKEVRLKAIQSAKSTWDAKYNGKHPMQTEEVKNKVKTTNMRKYGIEWIVGSSYFKNKVEENSMKKYHTRWPNQSEIVKESVRKKLLEKYGVDHYTKDPILRKRHTTIRKIATELKCLEFLRSKFNEVEHNYRSTLYPWKCDFYIVDIDTYVELNVFWVHNDHLYTGSKEDLEILNDWIEKSKTSDFYKRAIEIWTKLDVLKYNTAKNNKLNYLTFYSVDSLMNYFN